MTESPSRYGGIAAVLVFGIGLVAVGKTLAGLCAILLGIVAMGVLLARTSSGKARCAAVGALMLSGLLAFEAASNEFSGTATYHRGFGRGSRSEAVTIQSSPAKFRAATNLLWAWSVGSFLVGAGVFAISRRLDYGGSIL